MKESKLLLLLLLLLWWEHRIYYRFITTYLLRLIYNSWSPSSSSLLLLLSSWSSFTHSYDFTNRFLVDENSILGNTSDCNMKKLNRNNCRPGLALATLLLRSHSVQRYPHKACSSSSVKSSIKYGKLLHRPGRDVLVQGAPEPGIFQFTTSVLWMWMWMWMWVWVWVWVCECECECECGPQTSTTDPSFNRPGAISHVTYSSAPINTFHRFCSNVLQISRELSVTEPQPAPIVSNQIYHQPYQ